VGFLPLDSAEADREVLALFPARILLKEELLPLRRDNGSIEIASCRLFATRGLDTLRSLTGLRLKLVLSPREALLREMKKNLGVGADTIGALDEEKSVQVVDENTEDSNLDAGAEDEASIIRFVNQVLKDAIELRASDIHLEPFEHEFRIRYRIDGELQEIPLPAQLKQFQPAIVSRVKILSHLNIAEKRLPQDGRIKVRIEDTEVDIRVSVIPMLHGEAVVLRLLRQNSTLRGLAHIGLGDRELERFQKVLNLPHGIVLVTGPTGSGKTSTLYTALNEINDEVRKIITIEDPVEYQLRGVNQIQVSEKAGLTFARGLRSILRHDPDVVLIGEIRDRETAQIAVQASLTGHLVFSTLHTNDAPSAVARLIDIGVKPFLVASSARCLMAQRLVRKVCKKCAAPHTLTEQEIAGLGFTPEQAAAATARKGKGCPECNKTGCKGRFGLFEIFNINDEARKLIYDKVPSNVLRNRAREMGMRTLREDGMRKVLAGVTTVDEVVRATVSEH
jgi:general secretion pathway protein E/type IV pilus assembly protein PilB